MTKEERQIEIDRAHDALYAVLEEKSKAGVTEDQALGKFIYGIGVVLVENGQSIMGFTACAIGEHLNPDAGADRGGEKAKAAAKILSDLKVIPNLN